MDSTKIINLEKREMIPLTSEENKSYKKKKVCYLCKKELNTAKGRNLFKLYHKVRNQCHCTGKYRAATHNICHLGHKIPK